MPDRVGHDGDGVRNDGDGVRNDGDGVRNDGDGVGNDGDEGEGRAERAGGGSRSTSGMTRMGGVAGDGRRTFHCFNEFYVYLQVVWRDVSTFYERST